MNIITFDTETIGLEKAFCYDIGYTIYNTDTKKNIKQQEFIIEQIWSNKALFETAYYADKKALYVSKMRGRKAKLVKWGYAINEIIKDIKNFNIHSVYAFNSNFDTKVIDFNADWYKTRNFLDYVETFDIWGYVSKALYSDFGKEYKEFCDKNGFISESGNYMNNADTWGKFLYQDLEWNEEHTALEDSKIETKILIYCVENGLELDHHYKVYKTIKTENAPVKTLTIKQNGEEFNFDYNSKRESKKNGWVINLK